jgi:CheY-like chemotaxis protein
VKGDAKRRASALLQRRPGALQRRNVEATIADLAHEIRTPLTGILALSDLLASSELGARERGWANAIKDTAEHLSLLTSLVVDAARAGRKGLVLRHEQFRPRALAEALAASLAARAAAKGLDGATEISGALPEAVIGDQVRLRAALENLLDNALKFTARGGVSLSVTGEPAARGKVRLVFTVSDSGIGLTAAEIKQLFRPFAQANAEVARRYGGAGLGLSLVKRLAVAMGGELTVASERGRGSSFRLSIVVDKLAGAPARKRAAAAAVHALSILCVEDNPYGRVVLNTMLTELGHRADFVASGSAALDAVVNRGYDVVLMDLTLPDIDGMEAARRIRALSGPAARVPILGVSGPAGPPSEAAARAAGMNGCLTKPLSVGALSEALGALQDRAGSREARAKRRGAD